MMVKYWRIFFFGILLLSGCGDNATTPPPPPVATSITISPSSVAFQSLGDTEQLAATIVDQNGQVMAGAAVDWATSTPGVASVSSAGLVAAEGNGTATVTATSGSASASIPVTVEQVVAEIRVTPSVTEFASLGDTVRLTAEGQDANGNAVPTVDFDWSSNQQSVATVDADGLVTAIGNGSTTVTAAIGEVGAEASVTVAQRVAEVVVAPALSTLLSLGDTLRLSAEAFDAGGSPVLETSFYWSSEDESVATVDATGLVTAVRSGSVEVTAAAENATGSAAVTVVQTAVEVRMTQSAITLEALGDTTRLLAEALDANGHLVAEAHYTWSSSNELVATVDGTGLVTAIGNGSATVTATSGALGADASVTVSQRVAEVVVTPDASTLFSLGDTLRLSATALDALGSPVAGTGFVWSSEDESVATVDATGLVTAVRSGSVRVSASTEGTTGSAGVTVAQLAVEVRMTPAAIALEAIGDTARLVAEALDANGYLVVEAHYTWSSSNELVATVDGTGLVSAVGLGTSTVRAEAGGAGENHVGSATVAVAVRVEEIRVSPLNATVPAIGDTVRLIASAYDADGRMLPGAAFEWRSSDVEVAAVDEAGLVTGRGAGLATVTVSSAGYSAIASIIVGTALPSVQLVAVDEVRSGAAFDVALQLDMRVLSHAAGAVAVRISFDPRLLRYDANKDVASAHFITGFHNEGELRIVTSALGGLATPTTLFTLPFRAVGPAGSLPALEVALVQAIAAGSYDDISHLLVSLGQHIRIQP